MHINNNNNTNKYNYINNITNDYNLIIRLINHQVNKTNQSINHNNYTAN